MADASTKSFSLKRWSQRKLAAAREAQPVPVAAPIVAAEPEPGAPTAAPSIPPAAADAPLPPLESLTFDSDFAPFMQAKIDEGTKRAALKKLFSDPSFNVMDGLDIYVGDYTQADPMPAGMLGKLSAVYGLLDSNPSPPEVERTATGDAPAVPGATSETASAAAPAIAESKPASTASAPDAGDADETAKPG